MCPMWLHPSQASILTVKLDAEIMLLEGYCAGAQALLQTLQVLKAVNWIRLGLA